MSATFPASSLRRFRVKYYNNFTKEDCLDEFTFHNEPGNDALAQAVEQAKGLSKFGDYGIDEWDEEDQWWYTMIVDGVPIYNLK